ncbi:hypothetical protein Tco_0591025 [Tanacetum coccineum]
MKCLTRSITFTMNDIASVERLSILDHLDHICEEVSYLYSRLGNIESSIVQTKELSKVIKSKVAKKVQVVGLNGVHEDLQSQTKHISKYSSSFQDIQTQLQEVKDLLKSVREHKTAKNITPPEPSPKTQGEHAYKELTLPVSETKVNKESAMVLYNPEKDLVDLTTTDKPQPSVKQITDQLFGTTSSKFSPTPPREPTPPRDSSKGKAVTIIEEPRDEAFVSISRLKQEPNPKSAKAQTLPYPRGTSFPRGIR